jgi:hypothetical protein
MGFHFKGGSSLIWQIFFLFITKKLVIFFDNYCFSSVGSTKFAEIVGEIRQIFDIKMNFQIFKLIFNYFIL